MPPCALEKPVQVAKARAMAAALKSSSGGGAAGGGGGGGAAPGSDALAAAMAELDMEHYDDSDGEGGALDLILGTGNPGGWVLECSTGVGSLLLPPISTQCSQPNWA